MFLAVNRLPTLVVVVIVVFFSLSCAGGPKNNSEPKQEPVVETNVASVKEPVVQEPATPEPPVIVTEPEPTIFDPAAVTEAVKSATFVDVHVFIQSLNLIIRHQDYEAWRLNLTDNYILHYSDLSILSKYSEYPVMKAKNIKLQTLKDYFVYVVYPSRQNDKVDDIEFVGENLIKAITVSPKGDRNILYMLEKHGDIWKIGIGR